MNRIRFLLSCLALFAGLLALAPAQTKYPDPEKWERATTTDEQGLQQWAPFKGEKCANCDGAGTAKCVHCQAFADNKKCPECQMKKTAPCRACAGKGTLYDPLEKVHCPGCMGSGLNKCQTCDGRGIQKHQGSGEKVFDCVACKGEGAYKCTICNGARLVEVAMVKPSVKEAGAAPLQKARDAVEACLKGVQGFEPGKDARKDMKAWEKAITPAAIAALPPLKRGGKALDDYMKYVFMGSQFVGHEDKEANALREWKTSHEYYLKFQKRLLDVCLARAQANEKTLAEKKGKE